MADSLKVALVQTNLFWKNKQQNLQLLENLLLNSEQLAHIYLLPELFNTAFCVDDTALAEKENGHTALWMQDMAKQKNAVIAGSILIRKNKKIFNRFLWVNKNGIQYRYDKHYLFSLVNEHKNLTAGKKQILITYEGWKIQPFICYDLRFPAWCQNDRNAHLQLYVASWPKKRVHHWKLLLQARAVENQCYTIGVNRTGNDGYGHIHNGHSCAYDYSGELIQDCAQKNGIEIVELQKSKLKDYKRYYPFWKDR